MKLKSWIIITVASSRTGYKTPKVNWWSGYVLWYDCIWDNPGQNVKQIHARPGRELATEYYEMKSKNQDISQRRRKQMVVKMSTMLSQGWNHEGMTTLVQWKDDACHGNGEQSVLTWQDECGYTKGSDENIFTTIKYGWPEKAWRAGETIFLRNRNCSTGIVCKITLTMAWGWNWGGPLFGETFARQGRQWRNGCASWNGVIGHLGGWEMRAGQVRWAETDMRGLQK